ncbi:hypothetical protein [Serratia marcescens]|uniref:hypothetical protein n=1 Tax=Serratia marcescens TaxID=615 RepID=UPI002FD90CD4
MFSLPKTAGEAIAVAMCVLIVAAFIKSYLFAYAPFPHSTCSNCVYPADYTTIENERSHPKM